MNVKIPKTEEIALSELKEDPKNPNVMSRDKKRGLKRVIEQYGFLVPIITNKDNLIADGHQRYKVAKEMGMKEVPVIRLDVSEVDRVMIQQVMNKLKGQHDSDKDLERYSFIFDEGKFERFREFLPDAKDYESILNKNKTKKDVDSFDTGKAAKNPKYIVSVGDKYEMGNHVIMCGDSTNSEHVKDLMGKSYYICPDCNEKHYL